MTDHVSPARRSVIMSAVRGKHTVPEMLVRRAAHKLGLRFRLHRRDLPGRPDLVLPKHKTVVFVNGCFWHRHQGCKKASLPKSNVQFWMNKFEANKKRDLTNYAKLKALGWRVVVVWQCQVRSADRATRTIKSKFRFPKRGT